MPIVIEALYEGGVLKPDVPLPLKEHQRVRATIERWTPEVSRW
jgi:predicted DNA-binding antitoxin AbrB/MazE fold protein